MRLDNLASRDRKSALLKLHRQFAHPPRGKLEVLLTDAGVWQESFSEDNYSIYQNCLLCKQYASAIPKPAVGLPGAGKLNPFVSIRRNGTSNGSLLKSVIQLTGTSNVYF